MAKKLTKPQAQTLQDVAQGYITLSQPGFNMNKPDKVHWSSHARRKPSNQIIGRLELRGYVRRPRIGPLVKRMEAPFEITDAGREALRRDGYTVPGEETEPTDDE